MTDVYAIVVCLITHQNGSTEVRRPTFADFAVGLASVSHVSVINYLKSNLPTAMKIEIIDTLYFASREDYEKYLKSLY